MGKVPDLKRITVEDFPKENRDLVQKFAFIVNSFHEQVRSVLSKNVNFENLSQELKTITFTTNSTGQPLNQLSFRSDLFDRVQGMIPVRTVITSNNTSSAQQMPVITWSQNAKIVTITNIGGLQPETGYEIKLLTL